MNNLLKKSTFIVLLFISFNGFCVELSTTQKEAISKFIALVDNRDWINLSENISFPVRRNYPLSDIANKEEFLSNLNEFFDDSLIHLISNSHPDSNWYAAGSRGLRLMSGQIWLNTLGQLNSINYLTGLAKTKETELIKADRESLPVYLQEYERPVLTMDVEKWIIRIDQVKGMSYRFVGWIQGTRNPNRDAVEIIFNGFLQHEGSSGNHSYTFTNDLGTFVCRINEERTADAPEGELVILRDGVEYRKYGSIELNR